MANYTFTSNALTNSILLDIDGRQTYFGAKDLHPYTPNPTGNVIFLYDGTGILKNISGGSGDRISIDITTDTIDVDGTSVWANAGALIGALGVIFFLDNAERLSLNVVEVYEEADLPPTLALNTKYVIKAPITLTYGLTQQATSANEILSTVSGVNTIDFQSTDPFISGTGVRNLILDRLTVFTTENAQLFNLTGNGVNAIMQIYALCSFEGFTSLGTLSGYQIVLMDTCEISNVGDGLTITDTFGISIRGSSFNNTVDSGNAFFYINATASPYVLDVRNNGFFTNPNESAIYINPTSLPFLIAGTVFQNTALLSGDLFLEGSTASITAFADAGGGQVTVSTPDTTGLTNGDSIEISKTINYEGGYTISNLIVNTSFEITAAFAGDDGKGEWSNGSVNGKNPKVIAKDNAGQIDSKFIGSYFISNNATATVIPTSNVWQDFNFGAGVLTSTDNERFVVTNHVNGEIRYNGVSQFRGELVCVLSAQSTGGGIDYRFRIVYNSGGGYTMLPDDIEFINTFGSDTQMVFMTVPININPTDLLKPQLLRESGTSNLTIISLSMFVK